MDATLVTWLACGIIGIIQPFAQEAITRGRFQGRAATWLTMGASLFGGAIAVWLTGGFALVHIPAFTLLDPSPLLLFTLDQAAKVMLVSRLTYAIPGIGARPAGPPPAQDPGLVQKVAGTAPTS